MDRQEFCDIHWRYYMILEADFLKTERYLSFDLGDNNLYNENSPNNVGNSLAFSTEYVKQYQTICSEIDVIMKAICKEMQKPNKDNMKRDYTPIILGNIYWEKITRQKVAMRSTELQPFINWSEEPNYQPPDWWHLYNGVKHDRAVNFRNANLKNVLNALAGLYILNMYLIKYISNRDGSRDVPDDVSHLFNMIDWHTKDIVMGKDFYAITTQELTEMAEG